LAAACEAAGLWLVSDEIYHGLTYTRPAETALAHSAEAVVINSFSKYYSMTGWRIGWLVVPPRLVRPIERLAQNLYISPPTVAQVAALGAFDGSDELEANKRVYAENRELLLSELPKAGLTRILPADGAFYLYVDISEFGGDSVAFTRAMLADIGVAATPGVDFDAARGSRYLRLCYAGSTADMALAARRLKGWGATAPELRRKTYPRQLRLGSAAGLCLASMPRKGPARPSARLRPRTRAQGPRARARGGPRDFLAARYPTCRPWRRPCTRRAIPWSRIWCWGRRS
jgi:hypothetical protein